MSKIEPLRLANPTVIASKKAGLQHEYGRNVICVTDKRAAEKYEWLPDVRKRAHTGIGDPRFEIVVDASEGFIPLWAEHCTLRWRFDEVSLQATDDPPATAKAKIRALFDAAISAWGDACPVSFVEDAGLYDFEIVVRSQTRCTPNGCVLASAFFPDGGQHELVLYPTLFEQSSDEQVETLVHEIGHIFGLRHFFALLTETDWPAIIYGEHKKYSIMNYGADSRLTEADKRDLINLYKAVWNKKITAINGTRVEQFRPFTAT